MARHALQGVCHTPYAHASPLPAFLLSALWYYSPASLTSGRFFVIAFVVGTAKLLMFGDMDIFPQMMNATFEYAKSGFEISWD
jgi:hypothetical protein